jgi:hypothetical protein
VRREERASAGKKMGESVCVAAFTKYLEPDLGVSRRRWSAFGRVAGVSGPVTCGHLAMYD